MSKAKSAHYSKIISEHSGDHRYLWQAFNKMLHRCPKMYLPDHFSITALANTFSSFFINKISIIRSSFPVKYRVHFKICLLTYKALQEEQPLYLRSLIAISLPPRSLRSNRGITLSIPRIKPNTGARAFSSCATSLWKNLPLSVYSATSVAILRRRLKTYLFNLAFPP